MTHMNATSSTTPVTVLVFGSAADDSTITNLLLIYLVYLIKYFCLRSVPVQFGNISHGAFRGSGRAYACDCVFVFIFGLLSSFSFTGYNSFLNLFTDLYLCLFVIASPQKVSLMACCRSFSFHFTTLCCYLRSRQGNTLLHLQAQTDRH